MKSKHFEIYTAITEHENNTKSVSIYQYPNLKKPPTLTGNLQRTFTNSLRYLYFQKDKSGTGFPGGKPNKSIWTKNSAISLEGMEGNVTRAMPENISIEISLR